MKYIEVNVRTAFIVHGYDENNKEIIENVDETEFVTKLVSVQRILSVSEKYLLVSGSHGRVMYWEYDSTLKAFRSKLDGSGLVI